MSTLSLKPVVDAYYNLGAISAPRRGFNLGAIMGTSTVIPSATRGVVFDSVDDMIAYGFSLSDDEVKAAQVYFAAESKPASVYIFRWVETDTPATRTYNGPISDGNTVKIGDTTYTVGDGTSSTTTLDDLVAAAVTAGATIATHSENSLYLVFESNDTGSEAVVIALSVSKGTGESVGEVIYRAGEDGELPLEAVQAARTANNEWYAFGSAISLDETDIEDIADYIESTTNSYPSTYFANTSDSTVFNSSSSLFSVLKNKKYSRTIGTASSQPYTHIGIMGYAMGQTKDTANSSYTLGLKGIPGTLADNLTSTQVANVENNNGNVYINRGSYYDMYEKGKVFSGAWYDEIIQLDKLCNNIQLDITDLLYSNPKIPQTNAGMARILATLETRCQEAVKIGFAAPGQWNGSEILNLQTGDYLATGYLIQSESFESQSQADRDARKAPYIYIALKLAGAIQSVVIQVDVNR